MQTCFINLAFSILMLKTSPDTISRVQLLLLLPFQLGCYITWKPSQLHNPCRPTLVSGRFCGKAMMDDKLPGRTITGSVLKERCPALCFWTVCAFALQEALSLEELRQIPPPQPDNTEQGYNTERRKRRKRSRQEEEERGADRRKRSEEPTGANTRGFLTGGEPWQDHPPALSLSVWSGVNLLSHSLSGPERLPGDGSHINTYKKLNEAREQICDLQILSSSE